MERCTRVKVVGLVLALLASAEPGTAQTISELRLASSGSGLVGLTAGPDGNLWFIQGLGTGIGRMSLAGAATVFPVMGGSYPTNVTVGPDGNLWFTVRGGDRIGRADADGNVDYFQLPALRDPVDIVAGPDGALWFTEQGGNRIGRMTTTGVLTEYPLPVFPSSPFGICLGPDGNLWFTEANGYRIGRLTPTGGLTEFATQGTPIGITAGPDGALWFTQQFGNNIARITTSGQITEFAVPSAWAEPFWITSGPDGNLWFSERAAHKIGRITPAGVITEIPVPSGGQPFRLTTGPDLAIWFTEYDNDRIGRVNLTPFQAGPYSFHTLDPCRALDTRDPSGPTGGLPIGPVGVPDALLVLTPRCALPFDARAVSVNVTMTNVSAPGSLSIYRGDSAPTGTNAASFVAGKTRANNAIVQLALDGSGTIKVQNTSAGTLDLIIDVNGYFR